MKPNTLKQKSNRNIYYPALLQPFLSFLMATVTIVSLILCGIFISGCTNPKKYYSKNDFYSVCKIDAHFHYNTTNLEILKKARSVKFGLVSPNVDTESSLDKQWSVSDSILSRKEQGIAFLCSFKAENVFLPDFNDSTKKYIEQCLSQGASGIKIWKNIGMELKDTSGKYIMADDLLFDPIFRWIEKNHIPLLAHLGEPRNCWLPLEAMTDEGDKKYYKQHPEYHMFLHPEMPSYEDQIRARDHLLAKYPAIPFVGAHLGSLEWNTDSLAIRFDRYPNFSVDMAARIEHIKQQSRESYNKVRDFFIHYQDRILYGTDMEAMPSPPGTTAPPFDEILKKWLNDWIYLATDSTINNCKGLKLPSSVIDKIYYQNALRAYNLPKNFVSENR